MTFAEIADLVDDHLDEELRDCGVPMIYNLRDGLPRLYCPVCGLRFEHMAGQWVIADRGSRGIRLS